MVDATMPEPASPDLLTKPPLLYQLKVTLLETDPPIWRRILLPANTTLGKLHRILQVVMGWTDSHLHVFTAGGAQYSEPSPEWDIPMKDERRVPLSRIIATTGEAFVYEYDLGDSWVHQLVLEDVRPLEPLGQIAVCLGGERACPLEDSGGVHGYYEKLEVLRDPKHEEHEATNVWITSMAEAMGRTSFDPEALNVALINAALRKVR
jgi:pRiA4b ORF-3-like protein